MTFYYNDMPFESEEAAHEAFGSIKMYFRSKDLLGVNDRRLRGYVFMSEDVDKLAIINNAIEGSKAKAIDTGDTYILCNGEWKVWTSTSGGGSSHEDEYDWGNLDDEVPSGSDDDGDSTWEGI